MKISRFCLGLLLLVGIFLLLAACQANPSRTGGGGRETSDGIDKVSGSSTRNRQGERLLKLRIDNRDMAVDWEDNVAVRTLKEHLASQTLTVTLSRYGDFEQVGPLGMTLPSQDSNQTAQPGDIMLYNSSQIVFFYGSNNWSYTKLGHLSEQIDLANLLDKDHVTISLSVTD